MFIIPSSGAVEQAVSSSYAYSYTAALTPSVSKVSPYRGSTAGGTSLTITGRDQACQAALIIS